MIFREFREKVTFSPFLIILELSDGRVPGSSGDPKVLKRGKWEKPVVSQCPKVVSQGCPEVTKSGHPEDWNGDWDNTQQRINGGFSE